MDALDKKLEKIGFVKQFEDSKKATYLKTYNKNGGGTRLCRVDIEIGADHATIVCYEADSTCPYHQKRCYMSLYLDEASLFVKKMAKMKRRNKFKSLIYSPFHRKDG